jgi:type VII secretion-associated serine protease mycosin
VSAAGRRRSERTLRRLPTPRRARQSRGSGQAKHVRWPLIAALPLVALAPLSPPAAPLAALAAPTPATPASAAPASAAPTTGAPTTGAPTTGATVPAVIGAPNAATADLIRRREWSLTALHIPQAWRWSKGAGMTVAVLDTGVDGHHPDLVGRVIQGPDYTGRGRRPGNRYWGRHGTAMASIIAGHGHGPGRTAGVVGVAPLAKILSIRVTWENDDPERSDRTQVNRTRDAVAKGIRYAVDHGAQVINMSLGGGKMIYDGNPIEEDAVRYALSKGAILIASAGNDGAGLNRTNFPAAYPGVTAVGAVDRNLRPAKFTNRHDYVSVAAPGVDIISADAGRSYVQGTGTSPSAAIVAGIAALVRSRCPSLTPEQTKQALEQGTTHRPPGGRNTKIGAGVADAVKVIYAGNRICHAPPSQAVQPQTNTAGTAVRAHASLPLIGVLGGGGLLLVVSLFMGWRQRRRRVAVPYKTSEKYEAYDDGYDDEPDDPPPVQPPPQPRRAMARAPAPVGSNEPPRPPGHPPAGHPPTSRRAAGHRAGGPPPHRKPDHSTPEFGLLAAPVALPEPRTPAGPAQEFGDDPLGTGNIGPLLEASTPLADQSWEIVLRGRRNVDRGRASRPAEHESNGEPGDPLDFLGFETRYKPPSDT